MPISITHDSAAGITHATCRGVITLADLQHLRAELKRREVRSAALLVNLEHAHLELTQQDVRSLAALEPLFSRVAIFAPSPGAYGLARMYEILSDQTRHVAVFKDWDDAVDWVSARMPPRAYA